jgi:hypothetical protein
MKSQMHGRRGGYDRGISSIRKLHTGIISQKLNSVFSTEFLRKTRSVVKQYIKWKESICYFPEMKYDLLRPQNTNDVSFSCTIHITS